MATRSKLWRDARMQAIRFIRDDRGTTILESSIVMGTMLVLLFGAIDWSRFYYNRGRVRDAVRRGALFGARMPSGLFDSTTVATTTRAALLGSAVERNQGIVDVERMGVDGDDARVQVAWIDFPFTRATSLVMRLVRTDTVVAEFRLEQP